jgi:hypothetical protein
MSKRPTLTIPAFIARCNAYCEATGRNRVWLSKRLLDNTNRLDLLEKGECDVGVRRMAQAVDALAVLEDEHAAKAKANKAEVRAANKARKRREDDARDVLADCGFSPPGEA